MSNQPDVSLVMPVWQPRRDWFRQAVTSALAQVGCEIELLVIDDGSTPAAASMLDGIGDPRLRLHRIEHAGPSAARNAGTAAAAGRFIRYIDADDVLPPESTRVLLDHADDATIVHGATVVCDEDLEPTGRIACDASGLVARDCLLARFDVRHVSMLIPIDVARAAGPWDTDLSVGEDWDFVLRCVERAPVVPVTDVVTFYRRHPQSATRRATARAQALHGQRRVIEKYLERHPDASRNGDAAAAWSVFHSAWARRSLAEGSIRGFARDALALTRVSPMAAVSVWLEGVRHALRGLASRAARRPAAAALHD